MTITTVAPTIDANGITAPAYSDILEYLQSIYQGIYGSDVYLGPDSQDGQFLGALAQAFSDVNAIALSIYTSFSPNTAAGAALSSNVKINGLQRESATYSTAPVACVGVANTVITNGVATDVNGNRWDLPASVTIPSAGTVTVTATCEVLGAILAPAGTINGIATPTLGWQTVSNTSDATPGTPVEDDAELRYRQSISTSNPSLSVLDGIVGAVAAIDGVIRYQPYENDTGSTNSYGIPAYNTSIVVQGGDPVAIATAIAAKGYPGMPTYGTTSETITDVYGNQKTINFFFATDVAITCAISLKALTGYSSTVGQNIQNAVSAYVNQTALGGGESASVEWDGAVAAAKSVANANTFRIISLTLSGPSGAGAPDVPIAFNDAATCTPSAVTLTVS
ncbi:baseplate J/gp47 family protein [Dyella mobilis]|uniref:Baseplate J/gp47 family protein n=1 Tax=Dyella mobilis TaxID=1849582 RepID=A0ABS2KMC3_9GAMM|nr:baseplate J/gp47 family protein [Dyella mobilis]MBM7131543.1 baseplate J/gp47 family protein [Dyella mobilis]GLQ96486.1 hypothetical protein GCM10007863_09040 [Dyella mobilis]